LELIVSRIVTSILAFAIGVGATLQAAKPQKNAEGDKEMQLGNFSISLAVKDLAASRAFYEKLGFHAIGGNSKNWLILQNETATIGLFQGMFDKNIMTFNPGWDRNTRTLPKFDDVRDLQKTLKGKGITMTTTADESSTGPASFTLSDPDGNMILIDQHVPKPQK
jgi:catechol 2,3-dioxygenase-like lactoylglutathione lyase family enzyme